jgi:hypothetical protein
VCKWSATPAGLEPGQLRAVIVITGAAGRSEAFTAVFTTRECVLHRTSIRSQRENCRQQ